MARWTTPETHRSRNITQESGFVFSILARSDLGALHWCIHHLTRQATADGGPLRRALRSGVHFFSLFYLFRVAMSLGCGGAVSLSGAAKDDRPLSRVLLARRARRRRPRGARDARPATHSCPPRRVDDVPAIPLPLLRPSAAHSRGVSVSGGEGARGRTKPPRGEEDEQQEDQEEASGAFPSFGSSPT